VAGAGDFGAPAAISRSRAACRRVSIRARLLVALIAAAWGGLLAFGFMIRRDFYPDFLAFWYAARAFLHGLDPYAVTPSVAPYFVNDRFFYPFPSVLAIVPFAPFALPVAGALFFAVSSGLLAFALSRDGYARLTLFLSFPYVMAASLGQWAPLIMAAVLLPGLGFLAVCKPNIVCASIPFSARAISSAVGGSFLILSIWTFISFSISSSDLPGFARADIWNMPAISCVPSFAKTLWAISLV